MGYLYIYKCYENVLRAIRYGAERYCLRSYLASFSYLISIDIVRRAKNYCFRRYRTARAIVSGASLAYILSDSAVVSAS